MRFRPLKFCSLPPFRVHRPRAIRAKIAPMEVGDVQDAKEAEEFEGLLQPSCASRFDTCYDEDEEELVALIPSFASRRRRAATPHSAARSFINLC